MENKIIFVDGSSPRENFYPSSYCVFKDGKLRKSVVLEKNLPIYELELMALLEGLKLADENSIIFSDNLQVILEVTLRKNPKPKYNQSVDKAIQLIIDKNIKVKKIKRGNNLAGIYLEKRLKKLNKYGKGTTLKCVERAKRGKILERRNKKYGK